MDQFQVFQASSMPWWLFLSTEPLEHGWQWVLRCDRSCVAGHCASAHALATEMVLRGHWRRYSTSQENLIAQAPHRTIMPFKSLHSLGLSNNLQVQILMNIEFILFLFVVSSVGYCFHPSLLYISLDGATARGLTLTLGPPLPIYTPKGMEGDRGGQSSILTCFLTVELQNAHLDNL